MKGKKNAKERSCLAEREKEDRERQKQESKRRQFL